MPTFNCNYIQKFYVYNVDSKYDGLIGNDAYFYFGLSKLF